MTDVAAGTTTEPNPVAQEAVDVGAAALQLIEALSRELRTPLQNILGVSETLTRTALSSEQERLVRIILASADTLAEIVSNLTGEVRATVDRAHPTPAAAESTSSTGRRLRVLLADDHPINQEVVRLMLGEQAMVTVASHGAAAIEAFCREPFDIVLMDTEMPVLGGLPAIRRIRVLEQERELPRTPVISVSASAMPQDIESALGAGADAHVAKPITAATLFKTISEVLLQHPRPRAVA
jgi:CheY-like chemotaxis protein